MVRASPISSVTDIAFDDGFSTASRTSRRSKLLDAVFDEVLSNITNNRILFPRAQLILRSHKPPSPGYGLIHGVGIVAMLELPFGESQGIGDGAWQIDVAVTIVANLLINLLSQFEAGYLIVLDQSGVIDLRLVCR